MSVDKQRKNLVPVLLQIPLVLLELLSVPLLFTSSSSTSTSTTSTTNSTTTSTTTSTTCSPRIGSFAAGAGRYACLHSLCNRACAAEVNTSYDNILIEGSEGEYVLCAYYVPNNHRVVLRTHRLPRYHTMSSWHNSRQHVTRLLWGWIRIFLEPILYGGDQQRISQVHEWDSR